MVVVYVLYGSLIRMLFKLSLPLSKNLPKTHFPLFKTDFPSKLKLTFPFTCLPNPNFVIQIAMENNSPEIAPPNSLDSSKTLDGQTLASCSKLENSSTWGTEALMDNSEVRDAVLYTDEENEEKGSEIRDDGPSNLSPIVGSCSKNFDFDGEPLALNIKPSASDCGEGPPQRTPVDIESDPPVLTMLLEDVKPVVVVKCCIFVFFFFCFSWSIYEF